MNKLAFVDTYNNTLCAMIVHNRNWAHLPPLDLKVKFTMLALISHFVCTRNISASTVKLNFISSGGRKAQFK